MTDRYDVAIIGAGVVGASIARELSRFRIRVALFDKESDVSFGTSKANSGIIHSGIHSPSNSLKGKLAVEGNRAFDRLAEELGFPFERRGEMVVAFTLEELRILQSLYRQGTENRVSDMELIGRERALDLEPNINPDILGALLAPSAGIIEPYEYGFALVENAVQNGTDLLLREKVTWIGRNDGETLQIETDTGLKVSSRFVVNAAGLFADEVASLVGLTDFSIVTRKGEEYVLDRRVGGLIRRVIFPVPSSRSKGLLVIPTVEGTVMVGPTAEPCGSKNNFSTTRAGLKAVFRHAQQMVPAIRSSDVITSFAGLRPVAAGDGYVIGTTGVHGFINVAGIQSPGLTASPAIARLVRDILIREGLELDARTDFQPRRRPFPKLREIVKAGDFSGLKRIIAEDPRYSRLVCRCENVTEAEVVEAVRRGHETLDGIKYATRAGMGRCQGGFCTYRIMKILQREKGIPFDRISKKGPGSELLSEGMRRQAVRRSSNTGGAP